MYPLWGKADVCGRESYEKDVAKYCFTEKLGDLVWWEATLVLVGVA